MKTATNTSKAKRRQPTDNGEHHNPHTESVASTPSLYNWSFRKPSKKFIC